MVLYLEENLYRGVQWVVFQPNHALGWVQAWHGMGPFVHDLFRRGVFQGAKSHEACFVGCDLETTTQSNIDHGIASILVRLASLGTEEFVFVRIHESAGLAQA